MRDSEAAIEKLSVGRYMADRGHVEERQRNTRSGDVEENQEYLNIDEGTRLKCRIVFTGVFRNSALGIYLVFKWK